MNSVLFQSGNHRKCSLRLNLQIFPQNIKEKNSGWRMGLQHPRDASLVEAIENQNLEAIEAHFIMFPTALDTSNIQGEPAFHFVVSHGYDSNGMFINRYSKLVGIDSSLSSS